MDMYRKHSQDIGGVLAMVITGSLALFGKRLSRPRLFSTLNLAAMLVHQFLGIAHLRALREEQPPTRSDWIKAILLLPLFLVVGVVVPQQLLKDKESPYRFTEQQVGPYGRDGGDKNERSL